MYHALVNRYHKAIQKRNLTPTETIELQRTKADLEAFELEKLQGAKVRSRVRVMQANEKPSRFFSRRESRNASKKVIKALKTSNGVVTGLDDIMKEQVRFYRELYTERLVDTSAQEEMLPYVEKRLSEEEQLSMETALTAEECQNALRSAKHNKTPGSDGLPKEFYVTFWDLIKDDFTEVANDCFNKGELPLSLRRAIITLLYKKDDPEDLKNWHPISLLNMDYKILTKVVTNRLRPIMPSLIHQDQTCSVIGRSYEDNATLLRDLCSYVEAKQLTCAIISIDQDKAFDSVHWGFMNKVLQRMNFGSIIRGVIKCLCTNIQSAIFNNGHVSEFFDIYSGVRQGCPLSPLLFVLVAEAFGLAIRRCAEIKGLKLPGGREIKISQYADDNSCVVTNDYGITKVLDVFQMYGRASGAKLNDGKTKGLWLGKWRVRTDNPGGFEWINTNIKIVGYFIGNDTAPEDTWLLAIKKFTQTLNDWNCH